jgi:hypothetical protein
MNEVLRTIFMEFCIPMELVRLVKMCSYETCIHVQIFFFSPIDFLFTIVLKTETLYRYFFLSALEYHQEG